MDNTTDGTWDSLPVKLNDGILETLSELKFSHMTPVQVTLLSHFFKTIFSQFRKHIVLNIIFSFQSACIPLFMSNKDVAAEAVSDKKRDLLFFFSLTHTIL